MHVSVSSVCAHLCGSVYPVVSCPSVPFMTLLLSDNLQSPPRNINTGWIHSSLVVCGKEYALIHKGLFSPTCCIPCCSLLVLFPSLAQLASCVSVTETWLRSSRFQLYSKLPCAFNNTPTFSVLIYPPSLPLAYTCHSQLPLLESLSTVSTNYWYLLTILYIHVFV